MNEVEQFFDTFTRLGGTILFCFALLVLTVVLTYALMEEVKKRSIPPTQQGPRSYTPDDWGSYDKARRNRSGR